MLQVGVYKNYKELCGALGWDVKAGDSKKAQMKDLSKICVYKRVGNSFIIKRLKTDSLDIDKGRGLVFSITNLIIDMLSKSDNNYIKIKDIELFKELNIINNNYIKYAYNKKEYGLFSEIIGVDESITDYIIYLINDKINRTISSSLKYLKNKGTIDYEKFRLKEESSHNKFYYLYHIKYIKNSMGNNKLTKRDENRIKSYVNRAMLKSINNLVCNNSIKFKEIIDEKYFIDNGNKVSRLLIKNSKTVEEI